MKKLYGRSVECDNKMMQPSPDIKRERKIQVILFLFSDGFYPTGNETINNTVDDIALERILRNVRSVRVYYKISK